ncbi:alkaline phosphatase [Candidatus Latescibacterota bacterium]
MRRNTIISRRDFLAAGTGLGSAATLTCSNNNRAINGSTLSFGLVTDLHYAEKEMRINRYYRESGQKLQECIETFNGLNLSFVVELGDFVDKADKETELDYLHTIDSIFTGFNGDCHYVLGNHDVATFSKEEFIGNCGALENYYSFDDGDIHFIVLDANYNEDGSDYNAGNFIWTETYIPASEREWLKKDLQNANGKPTIAFIHQNLHDEDDPHGVNNAPEVRRILEEWGTVLAVFQGHDHRGGYACINGIHYVTFKAAVEGSGIENNAYAAVYVKEANTVQLQGYRRQKSYELVVNG